MSDAPDDYQVGPGRPPKHSKWVKGQSGNPSGRPKKQHTFQALVEAELDQKISIVENGRRRSVSKREALAKQLVNKALGGDQRAVKQVTELDATTANAKLEPNVTFVIEN